MVFVKASIFRVILGVLLFIYTQLFLAVASAEGVVRLQYSREVPETYQRLLDEDLQLMRGLQWRDSDGELARILGIPETNAKNLENWLGDRAHYIIDASTKVLVSEFVVLNDSAAYFKAASGVSTVSRAGQPKVKLEGRTYQTDVRAGAKAGAGVSIITMNNIGGVVFSYGKDLQKQMGFPISGIGVVEVNTSQVGIFRIGPGLFAVSSQEGGADPLAQFFQRVRRLKTLFHESRHGDGNGDWLLFPHSRCPVGHQFEGAPACDDSANGPYRIGSLITKSALESCQQSERCGARDVEALKLMYANDLLRILTPLQGGLEQDPTPEVLRLDQRPSLRPSIRGSY